MKQPIESLFTRARNLLRTKTNPPALTLPVSRRVKVLGLLADERDRVLLRAAGSARDWEVTLAASYPEAHGLLEKTESPVVLCDRDLPQQDWWSAVESLAACPHRACILLVSKVADDYLWNEIVRRGGYDVLSKPLQQDELERAVRLAFVYWNSTMNRATAPPTK